MRTAGVLFCTWLGCHAPTAPAALASHHAAPSAPAPAPDTEREPEANRFWPLFCAKPEACIADAWPAGQSQDGRALSVVALTSAADEPPESSTEPAAEAEEGQSRNHTCREYWLVSEALGDLTQRPRASRQRLAETCENDKWETFAEVDAEHRIVRYGGNSRFEFPRSFSTVTVGLDPVRLVETNQRVLDEQSSDRTWNWDEFAGTTTLGIDYCPGKVPAGVEVSSDADAPFLQVSAVAVPRLALPAEYLAGGWRTTELGTCAALVDGDRRGFALTAGGDPGSAANSTLKLLLSTSNDLFVEIADDQLVADRSGFERGDHLELWLATGARACVDPRAPSALSEWGVRISDGRAFAGFGRPPGALRTERASDASGKIRLRIQLAEKLQPDDRFTVVYVDREQGSSRKRAIATSELSPGHWWTLGEVTDIDSSTCIVTRGRLMASAHLWPFSADSASF
ncbi:MAG TPA: hypothetical protein VGC79_11225 [Polyangiaceae bacterium]